MKENQIVKLYKGKVELAYDDEKHTYTNTKTGKILNGVTSVLKVVDKSDALVPWAVKIDLTCFRDALLNSNHVGPWTAADLEELYEYSKREHDRQKELAAVFGTYVHGLVEMEAKGIKAETQDPLALARLEGFVRTVRDMDLHIFDSERIVMSKKYGYCGTADIIAHYDTGTYVVDIKTNTIKGYSKRSGLYNTYWYQTAAYQQAVEEEMGIELAGRIIIRIGEDGVEVGVESSREAFKKDFKAFLAAQTLYNRNNELKR